MKGFKMLQTVAGSPDGVNVYQYQEGEVYGPTTNPPMSKSLAEIFVKQSKVARVVNVAGPSETPEDGEKGPSEHLTAGASATEDSGSPTTREDVDDVTEE